MDRAAEEYVGRTRIPLSTYRLQLNQGFTFSDARSILEYLSDLGITDIYTSSYLKARSGSPHGYDIVDFTRLNDEIGSREEYDAFVLEQKRLGLGQMFDLVPNHMCIASPDNIWWMDVLENGPSSIYARFFDINWHPVKRELTNKVLVPFLGDQYGRVLENQELQLDFRDGGFFVSYWDYKFPIRPDTYMYILTYRIKELEAALSLENKELVELLSINTALTHLPAYTDTNPDKMVERNREKEIVKKRLQDLYTRSADVRAFIDENIAAFNGVRGEPKSFDLLDQLLQDQAFRLAYWRVASEEINYRRFFDINDLAAIRVEDPRVFSETHKLVFRLVTEETVTALRVDHPDGLYDPSRYFHNLQRSCFIQKGIGLKRRSGECTEDEAERAVMADELGREYDGMVFSSSKAKPFYIVGEKILMRDEEMPDEWPIFSTTGYTFCNLVNGLFVDPENARAFSRLYYRFTRKTYDYKQIVHEKKKFIMQRAMPSEINTLGHYLQRIAEKNRHTRDFTLASLIDAIVEVVAQFPVYRTYINNWNIPERDRRHIEFAVARGKRADPAINESIFDFLRDVLLLRCPPELNDEERGEWLDFVMRFQQITGPVMAKGLEDTALYIYNRLISLNEVGGNPDRFGTTVEEFHMHNGKRQSLWPYAMIGTSTHDSKRGEDVRARINVLSEIPEEWGKRVAGWSRLNRKKRIDLNGNRVPDANEEYFLYQTLVGTWPLGPREGSELPSFAGRIRDYMVKAIKEAKVNTSWINPQTDYENALSAFVEAIMAPGPENEFLADFEPFLKKVAYCGMFNSLSQTLLKIMSPGVPDFYQGTELWNLSLVDPDNRRPVDYEKRKAMLRDLRKWEKETAPAEIARELVANWEDARIKMYVTFKALNVRKEIGLLLNEADYIPLKAAGNRARHVCAFARRLSGEVLVVAVPRFLTGLLRSNPEPALREDAWHGSFLVTASEAPSRYRNVFTGEIVETAEYQGAAALPLGEVFGAFPVALLREVKESMGEGRGERKTERRSEAGDRASGLTE